MSLSVINVSIRYLKYGGLINRQKVGTIKLKRLKKRLIEV